MKYFGATPFIELLSPVIARDRTFCNAAHASNSILTPQAKYIPDVLLFARLAHDSGFARPVSMLAPLERLSQLANGLKSLPEDVLNLLAWQLHVEGYDEAISLKAKREMIWSSVILHRKRGTSWAVKHGLETTLQVPAKISEWFEYGGEPYFFRVELDVSGVVIDARALENAVKVIFCHKNVRSWLEYLKTKTVRMLPVSIGCGAVSCTKTQAFTWRWPFELACAPVRCAISLYGKSSMQASPVNREPEPGQLLPRSALSAYTFTRSKICPRQQ